VALALVATPGASDANAFADLDTAEAFVSYEPESVSDAWADLDSDQQTRALVAATREIDALPWDTLRGDAPATDTQALAWPRGDATTLPAKLVEATVALALARMAAFSDSATTTDLAALAPATTANIKEDTVGPITTVFFEPGASDVALAAFPPRVQRLLAGLVVPVASASAWGSGCARRAS
jgi:hypothetical protein